MYFLKWPKLSVCVYFVYCPALSTVSTVPLRQTFEDWALQTSPTRLTTGATSGTTTYTETAFEDWIEQQQMGPAVESTVAPPGVTMAAENGNSLTEDDICWETVEGAAEIRVELNDSETTLEDGTTIRRQTVTRRRVCPVSDMLIINGVSTEHRRGTDRLLDVTIEEDVLVLPPGVEDPDLSDDLRTTTDVEEMSELLEDGTPVKRRITTTTVVPAEHREFRPDFEPSDFPESEFPVELTDGDLQLEQSRQPMSDLATFAFDPTPESSAGYSQLLDIPPVTSAISNHQELEFPVEPTNRDLRSEHTADLDTFACDPLESTAGFPKPLQTGFPDSKMDIERCAEQVVAKTVEAALEEMRSTSAGWYMGRAKAVHMSLTFMLISAFPL